ncbi:MAG TPA: GAF domain-containing protein [Ktedonobacteraceae bacterium]
MHHQEEPANWRAFLGQIIENPGAKEQLARAIRVRPVTIQRWSEGSFRPREEHLRALIKHLPAEAYPLFMRLLLRDYPELIQDTVPPEQAPQLIPSEFYARALSNLALTPPPMYRLSMQDLLFQQILAHLDPDQRGLAISIVVCVPPRVTKKVRSLWKIGGLATPPWPYHLTEKPMFLGAEALVGYAVQHLRPAVINSKEELTFYPANWTEFERSVAAFPLLHQAGIVGGLIVSSAQEFFFTEQRLATLEAYSYLASCIFERQESYQDHEIELQMMPAYEQQLPFFQDYSQRVSRVYADAARTPNPLTLQQARQFIWQEIEEVMIQVFLRTAAMDGSPTIQPGG